MEEISAGSVAQAEETENILNQVYAYIDSKKDEIIQELITLASIKSVSDETSDIFNDQN